MDHDTDNDNSTFDDFIHSHFLPIIYSIICAAGLLGNGLVIVVFVFFEKNKKLTDVFFLNLAVADFLFLCVLPFQVFFLINGSWIFGNIVCKIMFGMYKVNFYTSMLTLTAITFDRFVSIVKVLKAQKYQQHKHRWGGAMCAMIWLVALLLSVPHFKFAKDQESFCMEDFVPLELRITIYSIHVAVGFFLPFLAMVFCYSFILNTLFRSKCFKKQKSIRIILTLVVVFIVTQLPFTITLSIFLKQSNDPTARLINIMAITEALSYFHACLNPILYFFVGSKFRNSFCKMLSICRVAKGWEDPSQGIEGSSRVVSASTHMEAFSLVQT